MSFFRKAKEATADLAAAGKRQAQRGKLELEVKRLEGKVSSEKDAIGHALFPLLEAGQLQTDVTEVADHMAKIKELTAEIEERRADIEKLGADDGTPEPPEAPSANGAGSD